MTDTATPDAAAFIARWKDSAAAEMANSQSFLGELSDLLGVPRPEPTVQDDSRNGYVFEKGVTFDDGLGHSSLGRIDQYRRGCFVLESKQGSERKAAEQTALSEKVRSAKQKSGTAQRGTRGWDQAMTRARNQARRYAEALPDEWPPFLVVCDVGHCFDLYADFARTGKNYIPFPDPQNYRVPLAKLADPAIRERLRLLWIDPLELDPSRRAAKVTRELAGKLAELAKRLERRHTPDAVAQFLMRCLFTLFAEDVDLIPKHSFHDLLVSLRDTPDHFAPMAESLWATMDTGGFSPILRAKLLVFNGGLFSDRTALPLDRDGLELLIEASEAEWTDVEPAIFGTLLERALDPRERHKLGAHYTPRAYVERLVVPTVMEPLRAEWDDIYAAAVQMDADGDTKAAAAAVREFHGKLCETRILDPACGSGNFLYVALELLKRLEGEVLAVLKEFGGSIPLLTVDPHQFLGIEINPRAAAIADLVLWIGYLQWHFRTRGKTTPPEPVLHAFHNIECRDAVLAHDGTELVLDAEGNPVTRWDGHTTKPHPVTGEQVPDDTARVPVLKYKNPRKAEWPTADYVVGNPPFIGDKMMKQTLGGGYVEGLRATYDSLGSSCDYVMYWWNRAAELVAEGYAHRFGFIATNSLRQNFNRRVMQPFLHNGDVSLTFAIPDHPWVDSADGAAVRISMTVAASNSFSGVLKRVEGERAGAEAAEVTFKEIVGVIRSDLTVGADVPSAAALVANRDISCPGVKLFGQGFLLTCVEAQELTRSDGDAVGQYIKDYIAAREITQTPQARKVVDMLGVSEDEFRNKLPATYQRLVDRVRSEREQNNRASYRRYWWLFGEPRKTFRFLPTSTVAEGSLIVIASDDAFHLGVLFSHIHVVWALAAGGTLEDRPRYNKTVCFDPFPFPAATEEQKETIRQLGEELDAHRKRQQASHPSLTMTGKYNVLEKLRAGEPLNAKEKTIHEQGLVSVLKELHDKLDAAVADAYGWPADLSDEEILERLVALNKERAAEEARGLVRWLRPEFQNPNAKATQKPLIDTPDEPAEMPKAKPAKVPKQPWPAGLTARIQAVRGLLAEGQAMTAEEAARRFTRAKTDGVAELLETLESLGQIRRVDGERFAV